MKWQDAARNEVKKQDAKAWNMLRAKLSQEARELRERFYAAVRLPRFRK